MCGIAGIADPGGIARTELGAMARVLRHRGPDDEGFALFDGHGPPIALRGDDTAPGLEALAHLDTWSQKATIGLAHRRLAILDVSPAGHQPMVAANGRLVITYNGEVYNYRELRRELAAAGHAFHSGSDTEVILAAYLEWGPRCVTRFVGMWAFAIRDQARGCLFLSRDRFGIKPLYYAQAGRRFVFASEIKALLEVAGVTRDVNTAAALDYVYDGSMPVSDATLFRDVRELQPGCNLLFHCEDGRAETNRWYDLATAVAAIEMPANDDVALAGYGSRFAEAIDLHLRSDVPVGTCLSGGLDSSLIVAYAAERVGAGPFNSFTAAYDDPTIDESAFARRVSDSLPVVRAHYVHPDASKLWNEIDRLVWHQDLPVGSTSMFAQWCVMKRAAGEGMKVLLDGQGADETLGGYAYFAGVFLLELLRAGRLGKFRSDAALLKENRSVNVWNEMGRVLYYCLPDRLQRTVFSRARVGSGFLTEDALRARSAAPPPVRIGRTVRESNILAIQLSLPSLLRYEDRNSMAYSIESRVPFLDHRLVEYGVALDSGLKIRDGWHKYVLRKTGESRLLPEVLWRRDKKGFLTPQRRWLGELRGLLQEYLGSYEWPAQLRREKIIEMAETDINNPTHLSEFWRMISFLKWLETYRIRM
ncbi:MAG: asparagine synthase (glutamine-hydrolyzing) [Gammaproteobacteria bacterium]|nr:asparagine synthase (glutamine-hydrolyzing) [Gammaproteobacteria bacterium]